VRRGIAEATDQSLEPSDCPIAIQCGNGHFVSVINRLSGIIMKISAIIGGALLLVSSAAVAQGSPATKAAPVAATAADVKPGASLRDMDGAPVGTIVSSTDQAVVVDTGQTKIGVPLTMFRKDAKGLLLSISGKQFGDAVAKAHARAQAQQAQQQPAQQPH
jgi:hypothetical protein